MIFSFTTRNYVSHKKYCFINAFDSHFIIITFQFVFFSFKLKLRTLLVTNVYSSFEIIPFEDQTQFQFTLKLKSQFLCQNKTFREWILVEIM